ncbi:MAG: sugar kinase [Alphaproteobacteria bacterium]|nr:MAG: sugar kinase [Alphaproteobacteria bacterium]
MSEDHPLAARAATMTTSHRGSNQSGMRAFNERLVLSLLRRHGGLAKSDIARLTGLSAQTVSVIMRSLEADELLVRGEPVRGRVGQPSVPLSLNPDGAYSIGLKIGRRSADLVLVDFLGRIVERAHVSYAFPTPADTVAFVRAVVPGFTERLGPRVDRIAGFGIAMPFEIWNWAEEVGAPGHAMDAWREFDVGEAIGQFCPWPVYIQNDATAACGAELVFGGHGGLQDFVYFYVGTFVGGGVVLNGSLYAGRTGNAGALGSMPVPGPDGRPVQLIDVASLVVLEWRLKADGIDPAPLWSSDADWRGFEGQAEQWLQPAAAALAHAIVAATSVIDFEVAMIDGGFPADIRARLVAATAAAFSRLDLQGIALPRLKAGSIGPIARALGGASLPLFDRYLIDQNTLMRETPDRSARS